MPVKLFTGLPGAGKTASLVAEIVKLRKDEPERPIYARGIDGLKAGLATELTDEMLHEWWKLPVKSILCIDECQEVGLMPLDRGHPAAWVRELSKVRHYGMDFLLVTQDPGMVSSYVRRLVDHHVHAVRKFNTQLVTRYTWGRCMDSPERRGAQRGATVSVGKLPAEVFELYDSASAHTMKRRVPRKVWFFAACLLVAVAAIAALPFAIGRVKDASEPLRAAPGAALSDVGRSLSPASEPDAADMALRRSDYVAWLKPRVPGLPWTAPAYDGQAVQSRPAVYCIAVEGGGCTCLSEQGTRLDVQPSMCRSIAVNGVYNPFLAPSEDRGRGRSADLVDSRAAAVGVGSDSAGSGGADSAYRPSGVPQLYVPPQLTTAQ